MINCFIVQWLKLRKAIFTQQCNNLTIQQCSPFCLMVSNICQTETVRQKPEDRQPESTFRLPITTSHSLFIAALPCNLFLWGIKML